MLIEELSFAGARGWCCVPYRMYSSLQQTALGSEGPLSMQGEHSVQLF